MVCDILVVTKDFLLLYLKTVWHNDLYDTICMNVSIAK